MNKDVALQTFTTVFKNSLVRRTFQPLNSWPLQLQYRFGSVFFFLAFIVIWLGWYYQQEVYCISSYDATKQVEDFKTNICLSYSYIEPTKDGRKKFILFYRWIPYVFLILSQVFYLPRLIMKCFGSPRMKGLFTYLTQPPQCYGNVEQSAKTLSVIREYFDDNIGTHKRIYLLFLCNHLFSGAICLASFYFLDFVLQGQFLQLSLFHLLIKRNGQPFSDPLSLVFPPFVTYRLKKVTGMMNSAEDTFYCHFTLMELYEKVFMITWLYLVVIVMIMAGSGLVFLVLPLPVLSKHLLRTSSGDCLETKRLLHSKLDFGDLFVLYLIKGQVSENVFHRVLEQVLEIALTHEEQETAVAQMFAHKRRSHHCGRKCFGSSYI